MCYNTIIIHAEDNMRHQNVYKFNFNRSSDLVCANFIRETHIGRSEPRTASGYYINLVLRGEGACTIRGSDRDLREGMLFFICDGEEFSISADGRLEYCYINFFGRRANEYIQRLGITSDNCVFEGYGELIPFWCDCLDRAEQGNIDILCEAVLLYSLGALRPVQKEQSDVVTKIMTITQEHFTNPDLSISAIADGIGYDTKYISALFKRRTGGAYTTFLRELRIKHAVFLMEEGVTSVKNVAILSGFRDPLYFSKVFAGSVGMSPKAYIQSIEERKKENK